jgi:hypothetical protein
MRQALERQRRHEHWYAKLVTEHGHCGVAAVASTKHTIVQRQPLIRCAIFPQRNLVVCAAAVVIEDRSRETAARLRLEFREV